MSQVSYQAALSALISPSTPGIFLSVIHLPPQFAPALVSLSSHTCFGQEGGVWGSHCLYSNGSVRWAIDDGVQSLLIPRLGETLWCGGTWKQRAAARDPKWSLTIIKYYHPAGGEAEIQGPRQGSGWARETRRVQGPQWVVYSYTPTPTNTHWTLGTHSQWTMLFSRVQCAFRPFHATSNVSQRQTFLASKAM